MFLFDCPTIEGHKNVDLIGYLASATFQRIFCERLPEQHLDVRLVPQAFSRRQPARRFQILRRDAQCHGLRWFLSSKQAAQRHRPLLLHPLPDFRLDLRTMSIPPAASSDSRENFGITAGFIFALGIFVLVPTIRKELG